jgi:3-oxoacyl-[acyl-carrier-protein] synthase II
VLSQTSQRVFITGMGIVSPLGLSWEENEQALRANRTAFRPVTLFDVSHRIAKTAASIDLPAENLFPHLGRRREWVDRGTMMLMLAIRECLRRARLNDWSGIDAMVIGTSAGAMPIGEDYFRHAVDSQHKVRGQLRRVDSYMPQTQMAMIAQEANWRGPITIVSNACASGANAIGHALGMIRTGRAKRVLAGGFDALADLVYSGFDSLKALAPSGIPRPFDAQRDG